MPITRPLADDLLQVRFTEADRDLAGSEALGRSGRSARTLVKDGPLRVTLIALGAGGRIAEHRAEGPITIQPVRGSIRVEARGQALSLTPGDLLALGRWVEHAVESADGGAFLLTVATPEDR